MILKGKRFAVGPVFFTMAMVLCVCSVGSWPPRRRVTPPARAAPGSFFVRPGASWRLRRVVEAGFLAAPVAPAPCRPGRGSSRRTRAVDAEASGLLGNDPTPNRVLACASEASSFVRVLLPKLRCVFFAGCSPTHTRNNRHRCTLQKTHTSSAAARCDFVQSSSRQHMHCMLSQSHREGTASSATARRRTPSWAL